MTSAISAWNIIFPNGGYFDDSTWALAWTGFDSFESSSFSLFNLNIIFGTKCFGSFDSSSSDFEISYS